jgi:hypothetical protein
VVEIAIITVRQVVDGNTLRTCEQTSQNNVSSFAPS